MIPSFTVVSFLSVVAAFPWLHPANQIIATNVMTAKRIIFFIFSPPLSMCDFFNQLITDKLTQKN